MLLMVSTPFRSVIIDQVHGLAVLEAEHLAPVAGDANAPLARAIALHPTRGLRTSPRCQAYHPCRGAVAVRRGDSGAIESRSRLLLADSVLARAVDKALAQFEVVVSEASVEELADVLSREKFDRYVSLQDREEFLRHLPQVMTMVFVLSEISDCKDPKDNRFLALTLDSESDWIVSGDAHLLALNSWRGIEIVSPGAFLAVDE